MWKGREGKGRTQPIGTGRANFRKDFAVYAQVNGAPLTGFKEGSTFFWSITCYCNFKTFPYNPIKAVNYLNWSLYSNS